MCRTPSPVRVLHVAHCIFTSARSTPARRRKRTPRLIRLKIKPFPAPVSGATRKTGCVAQHGGPPHRKQRSTQEKTRWLGARLLCDTVFEDSAETWLARRTTGPPRIPRRATGRGATAAWRENADTVTRHLCDRQTSQGRGPASTTTTHWTPSVRAVSKRTGGDCEGAGAEMQSAGS